MRFIRNVVVLGFAFCLPACATVIRGPNVELDVVTDPPGASVTTDLETDQSKRARSRNESRHQRLGEAADGETAIPVYFGCEATPCSIEVSRRDEFTLIVEKDGYHPATVEITSGFGRGGASNAAAGAAATATGAYVVSYSLVSALSSSFVTIISLGSTTASSAGAASAATASAAGIGALFLGVDLASGAMLDVRPNPVGLVLIPEDQPLPDASSGLIETEAQLEEILSRRDSGATE